MVFRHNVNQDKAEVSNRKLENKDHREAIPSGTDRILAEI